MLDVNKPLALQAASPTTTETKMLPPYFLSPHVTVTVLGKKEFAFTPPQHGLG
jgi:hypothetical protein